MTETILLLCHLFSSDCRGHQRPPLSRASMCPPPSPPFEDQCFEYRLVVKKLPICLKALPSDDVFFFKVVLNVHQEELANICGSDGELPRSSSVISCHRRRRSLGECVEVEVGFELVRWQKFFYLVVCSLYFQGGK